MIKLEIGASKTVPPQWLDDLNEEQRMRIELLFEEITESGASQNGIIRAMKHAYDKEIILARAHF